MRKLTTPKIKFDNSSGIYTYQPRKAEEDIMQSMTKYIGKMY